MYRIPLTLILIIFLTGCATASSTPIPTSGIEGTVTLGPMCPVMQANTPCPDRPYEATLVVRDASGTDVARVQSDAQGKFRLPLPPGTYAVQPLPPEGKPMPFAPEQTVTVSAQTFTPISIQYDSGIR